MAKSTPIDPNPCAQQETDDKNATENVKKQTAKRDAAWKKLNLLKDTIDPAEYTGIRRKLNLGEWPESILGPIDAPVHFYTTLVHAARDVYNAIQALKKAQEDANAASQALLACKRTPKYHKWVKDQAKRSACGAPCTSRERKGKPCGHTLTAKRVCPNHGQRPPVAVV